MLAEKKCLVYFCLKIHQCARKFLWNRYSSPINREIVRLFRLVGRFKWVLYLLLTSRYILQLTRKEVHVIISWGSVDSLTARQRCSNVIEQPIIAEVPVHALSTIRECYYRSNYCYSQCQARNVSFIINIYIYI